MQEEKKMTMSTAKKAATLTNLIATPIRKPSAFVLKGQSFWRLNGGGEMG
ncbi:MAG TPA: hypothetical protein VK519_00365 [Pinirhizobacter sp.]|nr:hypothetical protein [Pinirhizobacter sp.]HMH66349.1 hypothetical protein [Pinirhizobacter sp.]